MRYEMRPMVAWTDPETNPRRGSQIFKASWRDTLDLLGDEVGKLGGDLVVVQVDVREGDIRLDGMLKANAKVGHPGVAISFESSFGPLRYATDAHERQYRYASLDGWQANVRAIALSLTALRAVDRYGVSRRGEQYTGWKALPASTGVTFPSADEALRWMRAQDELEGAELTPTALYRKLARRWHPDAQTSDPGEWEKLSNARTLLTTAKMI
jgi:hypothetical protein